MKFKNLLSTLAIAAVVFMFGCSKDDDVNLNTAPTVNSSDPANEAANVALDKIVAVTFSEAMDSLTINAESFTVMEGTNAVPGVVAYSGTTATFTPTNSLVAETIYTATLTTEAKDIAGKAITADKVWSFTTGLLLDDISPEITLTAPVNDAKDIVLNKIVAVTFNEAMDSLTINVSSFTVMQGADAVSGVVAYSGTTATFTPTNSLVAETIYTATLTTEAKDIAGNALAADKVWSFTTGLLSDEISPEVTLTDPVKDAMDVLPSKIITAEFSEEMDASTITTSTFTVMQGTNVVSGTVDYSETTATFTPANSLVAETIYTATLTTEAKDLAGNALATAKVWSFTTGVLSDEISPEVTLTDPVNDAMDVLPSKIITAEFSEEMDASTITTSTFTVMEGTNVVSGAVDYSGTTATFTPDNSLAFATTYTAMLTTEAKDVAGNALAADKEWSFTTEDAPDEISPEIKSTDPVNDAVDILRSKIITAEFSEEMDASTITSSTFIVMEGTNEVSGVVDYSGTMATFTPDNSLVAAKIYTATLTTEVKDLAGNALAANKEWSFTTEVAAAGLAVVDLGTAGDYAILAKTAINNNPTSDITGDLGLSPAATSYITGLSLTDFTGYATSAQVTGQIFAADMAAPTAINLTTSVENMITAYNDAAGRPTPDFLNLGTGNLGGKTLVPGLYKWTSTVTLPTDVTISGGADDVWIFQISGDLNMSAAVNVTLEGGAQAKNIFWQVAGEATFGAASHFEGIILSMTGITFQTGATFNGRALAQTAVILDSNVIVEP
ncbi:MAG: Ig-like domain-containing protein [Labilibaculum antarcticum]